MSNTVSLKLREKLPVTESQFAFTVIHEDFIYLREHHISGIPKIQELVEEDGQLYVIEEYINGVSLKEVLDERGPLPFQVAANYMQQLCLILQPLHTLYPPIVHRDIKPGNIIILPSGKLYLIDFNSAKEAYGVKSRDTVLIGTVGYAAPEQYGFFESQPTADVYAMGVLFNVMLTGQMPQEKRYDGPGGYIVEKCLQMDPAARYQSAGELLVELHSGKEKNQSKFAQWLPPGFRSGKPYFISLALLWYALIIFMSATIRSSETKELMSIPYRIGTFVLFIVMTLWFGNYRDVWSRFALSRSRNNIVKAVGAILWGFLFLIVMILMISPFEQ